MYMEVTDSTSAGDEVECYSDSDSCSVVRRSDNSGRAAR